MALKKNKIRWGLLATGKIAHAFAQDLARSKTGVLHAAGSRSAQNARRFAQKYGLSRWHASYEALIQDPEVDVVYVSTPHPSHAEWSIRAMKAGKHVLCEKPVSLNLAEAQTMVATARKTGMFFMEAFMYRCHPQTVLLRHMIGSGVIGDLRMIQGAFSFNAKPALADRLVNARLGGGGILDVGCYPVSMSRLLAGTAQGRPFLDPVRVRGMAYLSADTGTDDYAAALLDFPGGIVAQVSCGVRLTQESTLRIYGTRGRMTVPQGWVPSSRGNPTVFLLECDGKKPRKISVPCRTGLYTLEADEVARCLKKGLQESPAMSWDDTLGNMKTLDAWRREVGLVYPMEKK
jgi:predicted dehydrogenase